ncbi:MAG: hypothetical protein ACI8XC_002501, partial [Gammaproteobacteria bacterium]
KLFNGNFFHRCPPFGLINISVTGLMLTLIYGAIDGAVKLAFVFII